MFILREEYACEAPVKVTAGGTVLGEFAAVFKVLPLARVEELARESGDELEVLREAWCGCRGVVREAGKETVEVPWSAEERDRLLGLPIVRAAVRDAWIAAMRGRVEKN
jgi:hypothetical protein